MGRRFHHDNVTYTSETGVTYTFASIIEKGCPAAPNHRDFVFTRRAEDGTRVYVTVRGKSIEDSVMEADARLKDAMTEMSAESYLTRQDIRGS